MLLEGIKTEMYPSTLVLPPGEPQSFVLACIPKEPGLLSILGTIIVINQCSRKVFQTVYMYSIVCTIVHIIPLLPLLCKLILLLSVCIINSSSHKVKVHYSSHYLNLSTVYSLFYSDNAGYKTVVFGVDNQCTVKIPGDPVVRVVPQLPQLRVKVLPSAESSSSGGGGAEGGKGDVGTNNGLRRKMSKVSLDKLELMDGES